LSHQQISLNVIHILQPLKQPDDVTGIDFTSGNAFDRVYLAHYAALHRYAYTFVQDGTLAEEMVHQVFLKLLEKNGVLDIHTSLKSYLFRAVYHESLNYIKQQKVRAGFRESALNNPLQHTETPAAQLQYTELEKHLHTAINELPEQCRTIFQLSRYEELKYTDIAAHLGLSVKTVETQMSRALKKLRISLADYLPLLAALLLQTIIYMLNSYERY
jgi:RNA polymerase sigma-70 factor (ECF subfamily)